MPDKKAKKELSKLKKIPRTVQQTIPYDSVFPNGIIKNDSYYSKSYRLKDANFTIEAQQKQESMFLDYEGFLNSIQPDMTAQITVFNRSVDPEIVKNRLLFKPKGDGLNNTRDEFNSILLEKMAEGRNNLKKEKYLTIALDAATTEDASVAFHRIDGDINSKIGRINKKDIPPMAIDERLSLLYDIYNENIDYPFSKKVSMLRKGNRIDLASLNAAGLTTKDLIGPESFTFYPSYFKMGDLYGRAFFLDNLPAFMNSDILTALSDLPCNMLTSVIYRPILPEKAAKMVQHQTTNIKENIVRAQKKAFNGKYSPDIIPTEMERAKEEADRLRIDMQSRNQLLFKVSVVIVLISQTQRLLDQHTASLKGIGIHNLAQVKVLHYQQEAGLNSALPLAHLDINIDRVLNTEASAIYFPFAVEELSQRHGLYYGLNAVSKNLIMYDRMRGDNYNGFISGKPGSGKSFIAKSELVQVLLGTNDDIYVIDPQGEYIDLAQKYGGEVIKIGIGSQTHINPLDMDIQYAGDEDPIAMKCDYLTAICETIVGEGNLDPIMVNIIHKSGKRIYKPYYEHMRNMINKFDNNGNRITCDRQAMPTLVDFYQDLLGQSNEHAQMLASAIEMYCVGNYDLFAKQTNVDLSSRFVVYDLRGIGIGMKKLALQICENDIWNRLIENKKRKIITRVYIDEFHVLMQTKASSQFTQQLYRMARKWGGAITGITQNIENMLTTDEGRVILGDCNFIILLNQSPIDRAALAELFSISENLQDYITDKPAGTGLIYTGNTIIPFINQFPKETELYSLMSTKATEDM